MEKNNKPQRKVFFDQDTERKLSIKASKSENDISAKIKESRVSAERFPGKESIKDKEEEIEFKTKNDNSNSLSNEEKAKLLTDFFKMAYYLDEGVLKHKVQEDKVKKIEKKLDSDDDDERLVYILRDLEKEIIAPNRIYFMNNEDLKYNMRLRSKKQIAKKASPAEMVTEVKPVLPEPEFEDDQYTKQRDIDDFYEVKDENNKEKNECIII